jgi:cytoskeletal protein CcmA (bactofilin family)
MFKRKLSKDIQIDTLIGAKTCIHGDVEFTGGLHLEGRINGDVKGALDGRAILSVSETGCIEGSVFAARVLVNGTVNGDIDATDRVELGAKARVLGSVRYSVIETAVGAQIYGKLNHRAPGGQVPPGYDPTGGEPTGGDLGAGDPTGGDSVAGDPAGGDSVAGDPTAAGGEVETPVGRPGTPAGESKP